MFVLTISPRSILQGQLPVFAALGLRGLRVNFGRNSVDENVELLRTCRAFERDHHWRWTVFVDLPGAKMRLERVAGGRLALAEGQAYRIDRRSTLPGDRERASAATARLRAHTRVGDRLVTGGGALLYMVDRADEELRCRVVRAGDVYSACGIAWADRYVPSERLDDDDRVALAAARPFADVVCPSFADDPRALLPADGPAVVAKIESPVALERLGEIAAVADGVMLGRGDLQSFYSLGEIDARAPAFVATARASGGRPVLATDYFRSMLESASLGADDRAALERALALEPDALVVNETAYAAGWREIAAEARGFEAARRREPIEWRVRPRS